MIQPQQKKSRTNLIVAVSLAAAIAVVGAIAIVVSTSRDDQPAAKPPAASSADTKRAAERDAVLAAATDAAEILTTLDAASIEDDLDRWESVATGALLDELKNGRASAAQKLRESGTKTVGTVLSAAVAELDGTKARVLLATSTKVTTANAEPTTKRNRLAMSLEKTPDGWQAAAINTV